MVGTGMKETMLGVNGFLFHYSICSRHENWILNPGGEVSGRKNDDSIAGKKFN